jgi:hypothetical protein
MILLNPHHEPIQFHMPRRGGTAWQVMLDSAVPERAEGPLVRAGQFYELIARSTALLREMRD